MSSESKDALCDLLVNKLMVGERLNDAEKAHLIGCESCMAVVVRQLDNAAEQRTRSPGRISGSTEADSAQDRPHANKALEHGREVFEREFGLSLRRDQT